MTIQESFREGVSELNISHSLLTKRDFFISDSQIVPRPCLDYIRRIQVPLHPICVVHKHLGDLFWQRLHHSHRPNLIGFLQLEPSDIVVQITHQGLRVG